ncbi:MAG: hypothetical protein H5T50_07630 [Nitrososphaeria archaeon]|nr:hypothetical protein [Nitrososphaeria archaeon]
MGYNNEHKRAEAEKSKIDDLCYKVTSNLLLALMIWLFGVLVFIPIAKTIGANVKLFIALIIFLPFTGLILQLFPKILELIDIFSLFSIKKFRFLRGVKEGERFLVFKSIYTIIFAIVIYLLYFPLLISFHPAINGIAIIIVVLTVFFILVRVLNIFFKQI